LSEIRTSFLINQVSVGLGRSAFVLPDELKRVYQLIRQKRDFEYLTLPLSKFIPGIKIADNEIQAYYQQNKEAYKTVEKMQVSYILLSPKDLSQQAQQKKQAAPTAAGTQQPMDQNQVFTQKSDQLSSLTYTNPNTLEIAAKKLGLTVQTSPWFTKAGLKEGVF